MYPRQPMRLRRRILLSVLIALVALFGILAIFAYSALHTVAVAIPESAKGAEPGSLVSAHRIAKYPAFLVKFLLSSVGLPEPVSVSHGITIYRVTYRTTNFDGSGIIASGLVALPNDGRAERVVVYLHGTTVQRKMAPSGSRFGEGALIAGAVAGTGNVLLAPDYIGLGESHALHPYMDAKATSSASIDFLRASRRLVEELQGAWPDDLCLMGFSQGGHATFALERELEKLHDPRFAVASAPIAGPFHLREITFPHAMAGKTKFDPLYLANIANAYSQIYHHPLQSILAGPYVEIVPKLFDGEQSIETVERALPTEPRKLFTAEFLDSFDKGKPHWFLSALAENDVINWTPSAPVRIYYGDEDLDVPAEEARRAETEMRRRGASVTALSVGPFNHLESALRAIPRAIQWFNEGVTAKSGS
jgi:pimeloyl-ACP methyl ester carboxylesterase